MIHIKIECGCGQPYAFDVEPILGQMPSPVACPSCGVDGTAAANAYLAQNCPASKPVIVVPAEPQPGRVAVSVPPVAGPPTGPTGALPHGRGSVLGAQQVDPAQIEQEARAKVLWGDAPEDVIKHLVIKGVHPDEAAGIVHAMLKERTAAIRVNGIRKMVIGAVLMCVPIGTLIAFLNIGVISPTIMGLTGVVGLWGGWMAFNGIFMLLAPKSEAGDVAEQ